MKKLGLLLYILCLMFLFVGCDNGKTLEENKEVFDKQKVVKISVERLPDISKDDDYYEMYHILVGLGIFNTDSDGLFLADELIDDKMKDKVMENHLDGFDIDGLDTLKRSELGLIIYEQFLIDKKYDLKIKEEDRGKILTYNYMDKVLNIKNNKEGKVTLESFLNLLLKEHKNLVFDTTKYVDVKDTTNEYVLKAYAMDLITLDKKGNSNATKFITREKAYKLIEHLNDF